MYLLGIFCIQTCSFINVDNIKSDMTLHSYVQLLPETFFVCRTFNGVYHTRIYLCTVCKKRVKLILPSENKMMAYYLEFRMDLFLTFFQTENWGSS
jgi:hypothetical protein